ncbi:uncharacterized protein LOC101850090 [Aplysia californica]|uniref:Uncharacterized protein LOC101850090 n=1 Tax=Aplysia californica TaxID=6500 RepID=A0ABM1A2H5_APLCA|nr:uncharacterized protein LOC101850090 [Aplysia californica]
MFLTGLLLQSGGLHVVMVTMPWVLGRFLHLVCQLVSLTSRKWLYICAGGEDTTMEEPDPEEALVRRQSTLLGSSESETSDVLWDRSWQLPGKPEVKVFDDDEASLLLPKTVHLGSAAKASTRIRSATLDLTTSSGTECSTTSQEQELEWEDRRGISLFAPCQSPVLPRPSYPLATRVSTLDIPPTETYDQRVRTWISQSTPEEETPPSLTLILNLDTTLDPGSELFVDRDRKTNLGALSHQRKNSF